MERTYLNQLNAVSMEHTLQGALVRTNTAAQIRLDVCFDDTIRVWACQDGVFIKDASYAVSEECFPCPPYRIEDCGDYFALVTDRLCVRAYKKKLRLAFYTADDKTLITQEYELYGMGFDDMGGFCVHMELAKNEHFYGLGEDNDAFGGNLDRRGSSRDMITGQTITDGCVTADYPITFFLSTGCAAGGYGIFADNSYRMKFDMGKKSDDYYYFTAQGGELLYYFMYGPDFSHILDRYTSITGRPSMLPLWAYGYIQCKCTFHDWEETEDVIDQFKRCDLPLDCIVFDYDWPQNFHNFQWADRWKGQSPEKITKYRKEGIQFMVSNSGPMIRKDSSNFQSALKAGVLAKDTNGNTITCGHYGGELMDFSHPGMRDWIWPQIKHLYDEGVRSWWLDLTEPEGDPDNTVYYDGPKAKVHNPFSLLNTKLYYEMFRDYDPDTRPFILTRTGTAGIQKYGATVWSGDVYSTYETFQAHCPEALNTVMSGLPGWTSDAGGFISKTYNNSLVEHGQRYKNDTLAQALLFERWMQFAAFSPIARSHHVGPSSPYMYGSLVLESCRRYLKLRYRLMPYIYSYAYRTHKTGAPLMRPLVFDYQNDPNVVNLKYQYLFGSELMVAPVLWENLTAVKVYFPKGRWLDYDYGCVYEGGQEYVVYAPQNRIPLFVKMGAIIPMAPQMNRTSEKPWDPVTFDIYPEGISSFTMYQDDGCSHRFEDGEFTQTTVQCDYSDPAFIRIAIQQSNKQFVPSVYEAICHVVHAPKEVNVGRRKLPRLNTLSEYQDAREGYYVDMFSMMFQFKFSTGSELRFDVSCKMDTTRTYAFSQPPQVTYVEPVGSASEEEDAQHPFILPPASLPCRLPAVNFDRGGEGVSYHTECCGNAAKLHREEPVPIIPSTDMSSAYVLDTVSDGDWYEYTVNVTEEGLYDIIVRLCPQEKGGCLMIEMDGKNISGVVYVPITAPCGEWMNLSIDSVMLESGEQVLRLYFKHGGCMVNYIEVKKQ